MTFSLKKQYISSFLCFLSVCSCNLAEPKPISIEKKETRSPQENQTTLLNGNAMTIDYRIIIGKLLTPGEKQTAEKLIKDVFKHVDLTYNKWNPDSEISKLNRLKAGIIASISTELERFFNLIDQIVIVTEGRFDPTIEPLQQLWKERLEAGKIPTENEIEEVIPLIGWKNIHYGQQMFSKDHDLTRLDLGGIAKGLCVDLLVEKLNAHGYPNVFVEWGGEIRSSGLHPEGRAWTIFISGLGDLEPEHAISLVSLRNAAIATSGDYLQNWTIETPGSENSSEIQKTSYCHIIDPWTYQPLKIDRHTVASSSVLASSCALADGLATAGMMFPNLADAKAWSEKIKEKYPEIAFWFASREQ